MVIKIILEVILGFIMLGLSSGFWNCVKSPKFLARILGDYEELKKFYHHIGNEKIKEESKAVNPKIGFSANIAIWIRSSVSTLDKTRNLLFLIIVCFLVASYFIGSVFLLINIALFFVMALPGIAAPAQNNIFSDIHTMMLNIYRWNEVNHTECDRFCNSEQPRMLKTIYKVITEE